MKPTHDSLLMCESCVGLISLTFLIYSWIYENTIHENYSSFTKTRPNKSNYKPDDEPENHREREKRGREREREKKRLATV